MENSTKFVFVLQGLDETVSNKWAYFVITLLVYLLTISMNVTLIFTIILEKTLHEPMLIFLCNLCVNGIFGASTFYPKLLMDLSSDMMVISYEACLGQMFVIFTYAFCEYTTLSVMAYDRYVAICKPLNYHSIISLQKIMKLLLFTWLFSISETVIVVALTARLPICGFKMDTLYCTNGAILKLSCGDVTLNNIYGYILMLFHVLEFVLILVSYIHIIRACVRSQEDRSKFMQTCLPHLITLTNFAFASMSHAMYARYGSTTRQQALYNFMALEYLIVPPILNPLIYGLKMNQIRQRIFRSCSWKHALK